MRFISSMPLVNCCQEKGVPAKGIYFPIFLGKNKITDFICLINHGIFPSNMQYIVLKYLQKLIIW